MTQRWALLAILCTPALLLGYLAASFAQEAGSPDWKSLERQYAEANLELAQARLGVAEFQNQEAAESVPEATRDSLQTEVKVAQERLRSLQGSGGNSPYAAQIVEAEARVNETEQEYQESLQANTVDPTAVSQAALRREQAEIAVAKARLAMLKSLHGQPVEVQLQWEIQQLQDEVRALWDRPLVEE